METPNKYWQIDAASSLQALLDDAACPPLLGGVLGGLPWQTRNEKTVAALLRAPRTAPLWTAALLALGAEVVLEDDTVTPLASPGQGKGQSTPVALRLPRREGQRWGIARVARTPADEPIVAAVAVVELAEGMVQAARLALAGAWPEPARLAQAAAQLVGGPLDAASIAATAAAIEAEVEPEGDWLGSAAYRRAMASVLARRALEACLKEGEG